MDSDSVEVEIVDGGDDDNDDDNSYSEESSSEDDDDDDDDDDDNDGSDNSNSPPTKEGVHTVINRRRNEEQQGHFNMRGMRDSVPPACGLPPPRVSHRSGASLDTLITHTQRLITSIAMVKNEYHLKVRNGQRPSLSMNTLTMSWLIRRE